MIESWRNAWGQGEFPFLFVQIAPHKKMTPELREAQLNIWRKTSGTAMVVTADCGDGNDIHPANKQPVGERLAKAALAIAYKKKIEYSGPVFSKMQIKKDKAILSFTHVGSGLQIQGDTCKGFEVAGANKEFFPASARIEGTKVVVSHKNVPKPVYIRYGWANVPVVNLYNKEGLPASPFRIYAE